MKWRRGKSSRDDEAPDDFEHVGDNSSLGGKLVLSAATLLCTVALALFGWQLHETYELHAEMVGVKTLVTSEFAKLNTTLSEQAEDYDALAARVTSLERKESARAIPHE